MSISTELAILFAERGDSEYGGEPVTQLEHALQCARLAERERASPALIVASLLHDVGHLLHELPVDAPEQGIDDHHENSGYRYLEKHFSAAVTEPVRLHVAAKRYLCTMDSDYTAQLSPPSLVSLELQGGKMSEAELSEFRTSPYWQDALRLRRWDDLAKEVDLETPPLEHFLKWVEQL
ncbi:MAG: HD domain-containing protein [Planctomycetales bacterium]|nr:HD domain-containing protein [Planctomycetales bacterium]